MTREELINLEKKIINCEGTEDQINTMVNLFNTNVPHPDGANLFYYPENYNSKIFDISQYNPSVDDVVDKALSYKQFRLNP